MADYFTNFSLILELPSETAQHYALDLAHQASLMMHGDENPEGIPDCLIGVLDGWSLETEAQETGNGWGIWMHSSYGGIDAVCAFIQHLLQKFDPNGCVSFQWSDDCSKPRIDAYGGGAAIITANRIKSINTGQWIQQQTKRLRVRTND